MRRIPMIFGLVALGLALLSALPAHLQASKPEPLAPAALADQHAPSVVSVAFVMRLRISVPSMGGAADEESTQVLPGLVLDERGLILVARPNMDMEELMGMAMGPGGQEIELESLPTDRISVRLPGQDRPLDARLVAEDTELGLSFVRINELGEHRLKPAALDANGKIAVGATHWMVTRLPERLGDAPFVNRAWVGARVTHPRAMWAVPAGVGTAGAPVFDVEGRLAGVLVRPKMEGSGESLLDMMSAASTSQGPGLFLIETAQVRRLVEGVAAKESR